jgi:hypothetical protein
VSEDTYDGPATVQAGAQTIEVELRAAGRTEPVDGRYHWGGRIRPQEVIAQLVRDGQRAVTVHIGERTGVAARLGDLDPWGGARLIGVGAPPWPVEYTVEGP